MADICWIASYPKSGNTWMRFMLASYLTRQPMSSVQVEPLNALIPVVGGGVFSSAELPERPGPLLVKTHSIPSAPALRPFAADTRKAIYLLRNPRDVILSLTNARAMRGAPGADIARDFIANRGMPLAGTEYEAWSTWPGNVRAWTAPGAAREHLPGVSVLTLRYEDLRAEPEATLHKVLDFLDLGEPVDPEYVALAVSSTSLDKMHELWGEESLAGENGKRVPKFLAGHGRTGQSLAGLGAEIEASYQKLFEADDDLAVVARQFGYAAT